MPLPPCRHAPLGRVPRPAGDHLPRAPAVSLTVAGRFAHWNEGLRPLPFTLGVLMLLVFIVMPGAGRLWKSLHAAATK